MTTSVSTNPQLVALLATLGRFRDDIADNLRKLGVRGHPGEGDRCPIANWLVANLPGAEAVSVDGEAIAVTLRRSKPDDPLRLAISTPQPVEEFVAAFDNGRYPDLIVEDDPAGVA